MGAIVSLLGTLRAATTVLRTDSLWGEVGDAVARYLRRRAWLRPEERAQRTAQVGLYHRIVWSLPKDALAGGWSVHLADGSTDVTEGLDETLDVAGAVLDARAAARRDGGAWLWPVTRDTDWSAPLTGPGEVTALHVLTEAEVTALDSERDPASPRWGRPSIVSVVALRGRVAQTIPRMHASRLIYVPGAAATPEQTTPNPDYDLPVLELYRDAIDDYEAGLAKTGRLLDRLSIPWVNLKDRAVMAGAADGVFERLSLLREGLSSAAGLLVLTGDDTAGWAGPSLAGVRDGINVLAERISAIEGWPLTDLFGTPPGGLSTDDEAGRRSKSALLGHERALLGGVLLDLYGLVLGPDPGRRIEWPPLDAPTATEAAAIALQRAQRDAVLIDAGVISPDESRERVRADGEMELDEGSAPDLADPLAGAEPPGAPAPGAAPGTPPQPGEPDVSLFDGLNGAQLASVTAIIDQLAIGATTPETATQLIVLAGVPEDISRRLVGSVRRRPPAE